MAVPFATTVNGYERQWQVNYLSPFLMTYHLMPLLLRAASLSGRRDRVRVVNVASDMAFALGPKQIQWDDVNMTKTKGMTELQ
jgi:NAD(P)-dependent dehydrogenase (short-subunit alcohol dehydrogenase family)